VPISCTEDVSIVSSRQSQPSNPTPFSWPSNGTENPNRTAVGLTRPSTWIPGTSLGMTLIIDGLREVGSQSAASNHPEILELPGVGRIEILGKEPAAVEERCPVAEFADDLAEIRPADLEDALVIQLVGLDDPAIGIL
jgi:hypothetical protein